MYFTCPANTVIKENRLKDFSFSFVKRNSAIEKYQALKIESNKTPFVFNVPNNSEELVLTPRCFGKGGRNGEDDISVSYFMDEFIRGVSGHQKQNLKKAVNLFKTKIIIIYEIEFRKKQTIPEDEIIRLFEIDDPHNKSKKSKKRVRSKSYQLPQIYRKTPSNWLSP